MYVADDKRYDAMQYRRSGRSGIQLPAVSLGLWHNFGGVDNFENSRAMLRRAFDLGITHFDLANNYGPPYGSAEETFGQILKQDFLALPRRADHLDQGRLGHVARALRRIWRLAQVPAGQPGPEPEAHGARVCRHLLPSPARSRHADGGIDGRARHGGAVGPGALRRHFQLTTPAHGAPRRSRFCAIWERRASFISRSIRCSCAIRRGTARRAGERRRGRDRLQPAGAGTAVGSLPEGNSQRLARRARFLSEEEGHRGSHSRQGSRAE